MSGSPPLALWRQRQKAGQWQQWRADGAHRNERQRRHEALDVPRRTVEVARVGQALQELELQIKPLGVGAADLRLARPLPAAEPEPQQVDVWVAQPHSTFWTRHWLE